MTSDSELRCRLAARNLPFVYYKQLCEWLDIYQYIPPNERALLLVQKSFNSASECFAHWRLLDLMEPTLTLREQERTWYLIQQINES